MLIIPHLGRLVIKAQGVTEHWDLIFCSNAWLFYSPVGLIEGKSYQWFASLMV